ncbi:hypothetical protein TNCV_5060261 [Trichonephila clavipes]|nr:hypothetical protein TNCV_5060261 [Trichonephila clavipes]
METNKGGNQSTNPLTIIRLSIYQDITQDIMLLNQGEDQREIEGTPCLKHQSYSPVSLETLKKSTETYHHPIERNYYQLSVVNI